MNPLLLVLLILLLFGGIGSWPSWGWGHSYGWGYGPVGGIVFVVVILVIFMALGRR